MLIASCLCSDAPAAKGDIGMLLRLLLLPMEIPIADCRWSEGIGMFLKARAITIYKAVVAVPVPRYVYVHTAHDMTRPGTYSHAHLRS